MKIAGPMLVFSNAAPGARSYPLSPLAGGNRVHTARYDIRVLARADATVKLALRLEHGADGMTSLPHSTPISSATIGAPPLAVGGEVDPSKGLGEFLHPIVDVDTTSTTTWALIEVYETRSDL